MLKTNVCILGAGPAGATAALYLEKMGIPAIIIDKAIFPRDKTCGEAMRVNVHFVLNDLDPNYLAEIEKDKIVVQSKTVRVIATNGVDLAINLGRAFCYMGKRYEFDNFLISKIKSKPTIQLIENQAIHKITKTENGYLLSNKSEDFQVETKLILFATGSNNHLVKQLHQTKATNNQQILGVRAYFKNVRFSDATTHIYFFKELYGGYLWIFPLPNGKANIGLAMKAEQVQKHNVNIRETFKKLLETERLQFFLKDATMDSNIGGATITLPTLGQSLSGDGYLLVGDSGLAVNPITGFGVGHAMLMGRYAAQSVQRCLVVDNYSAAILKSYDEMVYEMMGEEIKGGLSLTKLLGKPMLVNGLIRLFGNIPRFKKLFDNPDFSDNLNNPKFILKTLFF